MMFYSKPTKSMPGGFLLVFFGIMGWIYAILAGYASWLLWQREFIDHHDTGQNLTGLILKAIAGFLIGLLLIWWGLRLARNVPPYDTDDPKEPGFKW